MVFHMFGTLTKGHIVIKYRVLLTNHFLVPNEYDCPIAWCFGVSGVCYTTLVEILKCTAY